MLKPASSAFSIIGFQDSGILPPEGAIPSIKTSAPWSITS